MTAVAAIVAWLGGAVVLLSDGRRGLALGLALSAAGLGSLALLGSHYVEGAALLLGGAGGAALCLRGRPEGWGMVPPGSTPRLILSVVVGLVALWVGAAMTSGPDTALRFAVPAVLGLTTLRIFLGAHPAASTAAASLTALALGAGSLLATNAASLAACVAAALVAVGLQAIPHREADGA